MRFFCALLLCAGLLSASAGAAVPQLLNHQGRMIVNGVAFNGTGQFKFALVSDGGTVTRWSHDGTSVAGSAPAGSVALPVTRGLYAVLLGDTALAGMSALTAASLEGADLSLRVWFNDGANGFQQITPDQRMAAAAYSLVASRVEEVLLSDVLAPPVYPVVAWGGNSSGQTTVPAALTGDAVASISAGGSTSLALKKDGTVRQWGSGTAVPSGLTGVTAISCGPAHRLAVTGNTVTAWGDNTYGQSTTSTLTNISAAAAGEKHSVFLHLDGTVSTIGDNSFSQTLTPSLAGITAIAAGYDHSLALRPDGTIAAWGRNDTGQTDVPSHPPGYTAIAAGAYHSVAVRADGSVAAWGWNTAGQCDVPAGLTGVTQVAAGYGMSMALKGDGTVVAWGGNTSGQLILPASVSSVTSLAAGATHCLVLRADLLPAQVARLDQPNVFTGAMGIRRQAKANALEVEGNASKTTAGSWLANSDGRIKTDVQPVTSALATLDQVRLVDFRYTPEYLAAHPGTEDRRYLNVIAQEFRKVFPGHVQSSGERLPDGSEILQVDTYPLTIYSAAAVQELHKENQALKAQLTAQEERLRKLEAALTK